MEGTTEYGITSDVQDKGFVYDDPKARKVAEMFQLSPTEMRMLKECQQQAFYQTGFPAAVVTGGGLWYLMKTGTLKKNILFLTSASTFAFFAGSTYAWTNCTEKLFSMPGSTLKERMLHPVQQEQQPQRQQPQAFRSAYAPQGNQPQYSTAAPVRPGAPSEYNPNVTMDAEDLRRKQIAEAMNLQLTPQELKILKECQHDAVYTRGLPIGAVASGSFYYFMKSGKMVMNPFVVFGAGVVGFLVGTMSYRSTCMEKLLALPGSTLKERILQAQGRGPQVTVELPTQDSQSWLDSMMPLDRAPMESSLDVEPYQSHGFEDLPRNQADQDTHFALDPPLPPAGSAFTSYDDLRRQNREQYERSTASYSSRRPPATAPIPPPEQSQERPRDDPFNFPQRPRSDDFLR